MQDPDIMAGLTHRENTPVEGYRLDPGTGMYLPLPKKDSRKDQTPEQRQAAIDKAVAKRLRKMEKRRARDS
jgi:hypothetical protein